jgi:hypothetical protein
MRAPAVLIVLFAACSSDRSPAPMPAQAPAPAPACTFDPAPTTAARLASRDLATASGGPWIPGQGVFEYVSPSPRSADDRYVNANDAGGRSWIAVGPPLAFVMPANTALPGESLLRFGPPAALAFRPEAPGSYRVAVVACPTAGPAPELELVVLRRGQGADPIATAPAATLGYGATGPHPAEEPLWKAAARDLRDRFERTAEVTLGAGDVVVLVAVGSLGDDARAAGELVLAFDVAATPR